MEALAQSRYHSPLVTTPPPSWNALDALDLENRRVLLRVDLQRPPDHATLWDPEALDSAYPTLAKLLDRGARVIIAGHLSPEDLDPAAPKGQGTGGGTDRAPSLVETGEVIAKALQCEVHLPDEVVGDGVAKLIRDLRGRQVVLLENLAKDPREAQGDPELGKALAQLSDLYVGDAPDAASLALASTQESPSHFASSMRGVGTRLARHFQAAQEIRFRPANEATALLFARDRADIYTLAALAQLVERLSDADLLVLGGFLGLSMAQLRRDPAAFEAARLDREAAQHCNRILSRAREKGIEVRTPIDLLLTSDQAPNGDEPETCLVSDLPLRVPQDPGSESSAKVVGLGEKSRAQLQIPARYARILWLGSFSGSALGPFGLPPSSAERLAPTASEDRVLASALATGHASILCCGAGLDRLWAPSSRPSGLHFYRSLQCMLRLLAGAATPGLKALSSNEAPPPSDPADSIS